MKKTLSYRICNAFLQFFRGVTILFTLSFFIFFLSEDLKQLVLGTLDLIGREFPTLYFVACVSSITCSFAISAREHSLFTSVIVHSILSLSLVVTIMYLEKLAGFNSQTLLCGINSFISLLIFVSFEGEIKRMLSIENRKQLREKEMVESFSTN